MKARTEPKQFIADFFTSYSAEVIDGDEDPAVVVDRYHTPDIIQVADGHAMDRTKIVDHVSPLRKTKPSNRIEVHEALVDGDTIAARYTMHVQTRKKAMTIEVCFFGRFAEDGRMRSANMLTRTSD